jgi:hypothetical protein
MNNGHVKEEEEEKEDEKEMIGIPTQPRTPAGSPLAEPQPQTPAGSPEPSPPPSMEHILASMEKVDRDIVDMDRVIKKVNTELAVSKLYFPVVSTC